MLNRQTHHRQFQRLLIHLFEKSSKSKKPLTKFYELCRQSQLSYTITLSRGYCTYNVTSELSSRQSNRSKSSSSSFPLYIGDTNSGNVCNHAAKAKRSFRSRAWFMLGSNFLTQICDPIMQFNITRFCVGLDS
jgi:hypothetical protein